MIGYQEADEYLIDVEPGPLRSRLSEPTTATCGSAYVSHAVNVLRNERVILEDVRRQLIADAGCEDRHMLLRANWQELGDVKAALRLISVDALAKRMGQG